MKLRCPLCSTELETDEQLPESIVCPACEAEAPAAHFMRPPPVPPPLPVISVTPAPVQMVAKMASEVSWIARGFRTLLLLVGLIAAVVVGLPILLGIVGGVAKSQQEEILKGADFRIERFQFTGKEITGVFVNGSPVHIRLASLEFSVFDGQGRKIRQTYDSMQNLAPNESWSFKTTLWGEEAAKVRLEVAKVNWTEISPTIVR
jgi:hypothetical protein